MIAKNYLLATVICLSFPLFAQENRKLIEAQKKLQTTFFNLSVVDFRPSQIPELFEVNLGDKIIYFHPEKELLVFGEIFSKDGQSLTAQSLARQTASLLKKAPFESGLAIGKPGGVEVVEFCNPDCPYSRRFDALLRELSAKYAFSRRLFFVARNAQATAKAVHVLCAADPDKALAQILSGENIPLVHCQKAAERLHQQRQVVENLGVSGTPSFLQDGKLVTGFKPEALVDFLEKSATKEG